MARKIWTDPIVAEVQKIREEIAREAGYDMDKLVARLQISQKQRGDRLVTRPPQRLQK